MKAISTCLFSTILLMLLSAFQTPTSTSHCWVVVESVPPVDEPTTPVVENEITLPDGTVVKNTGKKGDPSVKVRHCSGCETHSAHSEIEANGAGNNLTVVVAGNNSTVHVNGGTGPKAGSRIVQTGDGNTVRTSGDKNCVADGGKKNTTFFGPGSGNHTHSYPLPPPH